MGSHPARRLARFVIPRILAHPSRGSHRWWGGGYPASRARTYPPIRIAVLPDYPLYGNHSQSIPPQRGWDRLESAIQQCGNPAQGYARAREAG